MATSFFNDNDKLKGAWNYASWKFKLDTNLDGEDVLEYVQGGVPQPPKNSLDATKERYNKGEIKAHKIIIDSLKDHLLTCISKLKTSKKMYDKIVGIFEV